MYVANEAYEAKTSCNEWLSATDQLKSNSPLCVHMYVIVQCSITCRTQSMLFNCANSLDNQVQIWTILGDTYPAVAVAFVPACMDEHITV